MVQRILAIAAWGCLVAIAVATLAPIRLRPHLGPQDLEYLLAFGVTGLLFGLAYPRRLILLGGMVLGSALVLEALQQLTPDRHGRLGDLIFKLAGGVLGLCVAAIVARLLRRWGDRTRVEE